MQKKISSLLWNTWCVASVIGIWPQYLEPNLLFQRKLAFFIPTLPEKLNGLRIVHFSDLHAPSGTSERFLKRIYDKIKKAAPDLIIFTGDFLISSRLERGAAKILQTFFSSLVKICPLYAVLGNHDYEKAVTVDETGAYALAKKKTSIPLIEGFKRLLSSKKALKGSADAPLQTLSPHPLLKEVLKKCGVTCLHNETILHDFPGGNLNITGLGEHMLGQSAPKKAFENYNACHPGLVLVHNPDAWPTLFSFPGDLLLSGHTHRGQVNLPWMRDRFVPLEYPEYRWGRFLFENKGGFVTSGVGGTLRFRWLAPPEIVIIELNQGPLGWKEAV